MGYLLNGLFFSFLLSCVYCTILEKDCKKLKINENLLQSGQGYKYRYHSVAEGAAVGTSDQLTKLDLACDVLIQHIVVECAFSMSLSKCKLSASGGSSNAENHWIKDQDLPSLTRHAIVFTLNDGKIKSVIAHPKEPLFSLNIKRGIISAFTVSKTALENGEKKKHTDVHGVCPWEVKPIGPNKAVSVKNMLRCSIPSRNDWHFSPYSIFWNMSFIQNLINSSTICNYETNDQHLKRVDCHERHAIMLESTHRTTTAVQTNIRYELDLIMTKPLMDHVFLDESLSRVTSIQFEYEEAQMPILQPRDFKEKAQNILSDLVLTSEEEIRLFSVTFFHEFVAWLRTGEDLLPFVETLLTCGFVTDGRPCQDWIRDQGMSYTVDALVQCNTVPCMKAFTYLATHNHVPDSYLNFALYSWTNMHGIHPDYVSEILKICKEKKSRSCWLSLGSVINTCANEHHHSHHSIPQGIQDTVGYLMSFIGKNCNIKDADFGSGMDENKKNDYMLLMLKTLGNIGEVARMANEEITEKLYECSQNQNLMSHVKVAAIEAMNKMEGNDFTYEMLMRLLKNESELVELRLAAYNVLVGHFGHQEFVSELVNLVRKESISQVKGYVASHLQQVLVAAENYENKELYKNLEILLERLKFNLHSIQVDPSRTSHRTLRRMRGITWDSDIIFNTFSAIPETLRSNISLELFDKLYNFMEVGFKSGGWDRVIVQTEAILGSVQQPVPIVQYVAMIMQQIAGRARKSTAKTILLDRKLEENIDKLHELYKQAHQSLKPYFIAYIKMFGNELDFTTLDDMMSILRKKLQQVTSSHGSRQPNNVFSVNSTHVIRIIEAYHQFPTLMGLPLNWTTNATLAFSTRAGFKLDIQGKYIQEQTMKAQVFFYPSAALTFVNRMVLDFPTVTQIGIQANSSAYTSTQWEMSVQRPPSGVISLSVKIPERVQKPLQLFRTNQFIKHDRYEDIPDWDVLRVSKKWCMHSKFVQDTGLDVCVDTSYVNVTHLIKPWFLMCGSAKWSLTAEKIDKGLQAYNMDVIYKSIDRSTKELKLNFNAPGSLLKREIPLTLKVNTQTSEMLLDIRHSDDPNFEFMLSRKKLQDDGKDTGYQSSLHVKDQREEFHLTYSKVSRVELREPADMNKTPTGRKTEATVDERDLHLSTIRNAYHYKSKVHLHDGNLKADVLLTYENKDPKWNWLKKILSNIFWENDERASIELRANWRAPIKRGKESRLRHTTSHLVVPHSVMEISTHTVHKGARQESIHVNLTNTEKASGRLLTFAKLACTSQHTEGTNGALYVGIYNLTIPRNSWALEVNREKGNHKKSYVITFRKSTMVEKDASDGLSVGWWHPSQSHRFEHKEWKSVLKMKLRDETSRHLPVEFRGEIPDWSDALGQTVHASLKLLYLHLGKEQTVHMNGNFSILSNKKFVSFQRDFSISSSRFGLRLDSHSAHLKRRNLKIHLTHKTTLTDTQSGSHRGVYMLGARGDLGSRCPYLDIRHNITSQWMEFSSNITTTCKPERRGAHLIKIQNVFTFPYWSELSSRLHQVYDFDLPGGESMNFTSGIIDIGVTGEWNQTRYLKKAAFRSKTDLLPSTDWQLILTKPREAVLDVTSVAGPLKHVVIRSQVDQQWKEFTTAIKVMHEDSKEEQDLNVVVRLLGPNDIGFLLNLSKNHKPLVREFLKKTIAMTLQRLKEIAYDPKHGINHFLQPKTLGESFDALKDEIQKYLLKFEQDTLKCVEAFSSIYKPALEMLSNVNKELTKLANKADHHFRRTVPGWAFYYFDVPQQAQYYLKHLPQRISGDSRQITLFFHHPFFWERFSEKPVLSQSTWMGHLLKDAPAGREKRAMIFGTSSVLTFDGHFFAYPSYPEPNCAYLLAHDVHGKTFTAVTTSTMQYFLFSGMAMTLDHSGEVYINQSKTPQSLPYQSTNGKVSIARERNEIVVKTPGFDAICDMSQYCIYKIGSLFHGGTIGILGNGDGEVLNDFVAPDGRILENAATLGQVYDVSGRTACQLLQDPSTPYRNPEVVSECSQSLGYVDRCAKRAGFSRIALMDACIQGGSEEMCIMANSVARYCAQYMVYTKSCDKCGSPDGVSKPLSEGVWQERVKFQLEVTLIVDQHRSMFGESRTGLKGIENFVNDLDEHFKSNGYSSVVYCLIGFGGSGVYSSPSIHTLNSKLWFQSKDVPDLLGTLSYQGHDRGDGIKAVKYATTIPNERSASKAYVLFTVNDQMWQLPRTIYDTQELLEDNGVTLFTVASYPDLEKGKKVFGIRADGFMFPQRGGEAYLDFPTTPLAKLTSATRGSIFLKGFIEDNKNAFFFNEFAEEIGAKVGKEARLCRRCECSPKIKCKLSECE